ncbi:uncharacterized protein LOC110818585 [Carica papaya]|uniref:uncharacterized protein LOC110818585 n=1 Tax=Carica papaya TaxID=3649 RepID=UPI000B8D0208|nr:uncharacterized protein LOC110818585 [Carica papaya]
MEIVRKEIGLEWMLRPADRTDKGPTITAGMKSEDMMLEEPSTEEIKKVNPKELNPYLKENGTGYPEEEDERKGGGDQFLSSSLLGMECKLENEILEASQEQQIEKDGA